MLERFRKAKAKEIADLTKLADQGKMPSPQTGLRPPFAAGLKTAGPLPVIAEYKRASPSKGDINLTVAPEAVALAYATAGAGAISVLTEEDYFKGSLEFLDRMTGPGLPLLRKDFILHPLQVAQTAATPASAFLLIARMLEDAMLTALLREGERHGLEAVVEVFSVADLERAQAASASIIQVNNRDLDTLKTDFAVARTLAPKKRPGRLWIAASGIKTRADVETMAALGFDAVLVGTSIMSEPDPGAALAALAGQTEKAAS